MCQWRPRLSTPSTVPGTWKMLIALFIQLSKHLLSTYYVRGSTAAELSRKVGKISLQDLSSAPHRAGGVNFPWSELASLNYRFILDTPWKLASSGTGTKTCTANAVPRLVCNWSLSS